MRQSIQKNAGDGETGTTQEIKVNNQEAGSNFNDTITEPPGTNRTQPPPSNQAPSPPQDRVFLKDKILIIVNFIFFINMVMVMVMVKNQRFHKRVYTFMKSNIK